VVRAPVWFQPFYFRIITEHLKQFQCSTNATTTTNATSWRIVRCVTLQAQKPAVPAILLHIVARLVKSPIGHCIRKSAKTSTPHRDRPASTNAPSSCSQMQINHSQRGFGVRKCPGIPQMAMAWSKPPISAISLALVPTTMFQSTGTFSASKILITRLSLSA
jgi:hypothetical protein